MEEIPFACGQKKRRNYVMDKSIVTSRKVLIQSSIEGCWSKSKVTILIENC